MTTRSLLLRDFTFGVFVEVFVFKKRLKKDKRTTSQGKRGLRSVFMILGRGSVQCLRSWGKGVSITILYFYNKILLEVERHINMISMLLKGWMEQTDIQYSGYKVAPRTGYRSSIFMYKSLRFFLDLSVRNDPWGESDNCILVWNKQGSIKMY